MALTMFSSPGGNVDILTETLSIFVLLVSATENGETKVKEYVNS